VPGLRSASRLVPVPRLPGAPGRTRSEPARLPGLPAILPLIALYLLVSALIQPGPDPVRDEPAFLAAAERLVTHGALADDEANADQRAFLWHGPGLIVVLAPFVALDVSLITLRFIGPLLLGAAVALFYLLLRLRLPARAALAWTYAFGLYAPFLPVLGTLQKEPLSILLVVAGMFALTRALAGGRPVPLAAAGLALAALTMVRPEYGWVTLALLAMAFAWWLRHRHGVVASRALAVAAIAAAACMPWLVYTHAKTGQVLYWSSSSGLSMFWMSPTLPGETGQWHSPVRVYRDPALAPYRPLFRRLDRVPPLQSDRELRRHAAANIRADPLRYGRNLAANVSRLLFSVPARRHVSPVALAELVLFNGSLIVAVAWAARVLWRRHPSLPPETAAIALFTTLAVGVHIPPSASPRMLLPVVPALVWLVALAGTTRRVTRRGAAGPD
jgi:hypothetical protein